LCAVFYLTILFYPFQRTPFLLNIVIATMNYRLQVYAGPDRVLPSSSYKFFIKKTYKTVAKVLYRKKKPLSAESGFLMDKIV
jgi:hypothetical protein